MATDVINLAMLSDGDYKVILVGSVSPYSKGGKIYVVPVEDVPARLKEYKHALLQAYIDDVEEAIEDHKERCYEDYKCSTAQSVQELYKYTDEQWEESLYQYQLNQSSKYMVKVMDRVIVE